MVLVLWVVGGAGCGTGRGGAPKKKFLQDLETIRSMILQDLACKITIDFETIYLVRSCLMNLERSLIIIPVRSHKQDLGLKVL